MKKMFKNNLNFWSCNNKQAVLTGSLLNVQGMCQLIQFLGKVSEIQSGLKKLLQVCCY